MVELGPSLPLIVVAALTAVGCGIVSGAFFAFSTFAMQGIAALETPAAVRAMQSVNVAAVRPPLMIALFGTAVLSIVMIILGVLGLGQGHGWWFLIGGLLYLIGNPVLTIVYNVPRNNALAAVDPDTPEAAEVWQRYQREWVPANTVRSVTAALAAALMIIGLAVS
ncbi:anthrone oxygenase family protein [Microlunatus parietis]|uniref:Putative membrane protein n=1 Tax=Microlunatus parietis TaxID=682979 RepID=A0A7Y9I5D5_9ACTN|nr:anthrone oxygenase family protein [Microlunatus parietis]NYE70009.1 putative membrane protein [Microlunatus parietis]